MTYIPIKIDRSNLTIMGVPFPDLDTLETVAMGLGTNMFEGYVPTMRGVEMMRDYVLGKLSTSAMINLVKSRYYAD